MRSASEEDLLSKIRKIAHQAHDHPESWIATGMDLWGPRKQNSNDPALHTQFLALLGHELQASANLAKRVEKVELAASNAERVATEALVAAEALRKTNASTAPSRLHEAVASKIRMRVAKLSGITAAYLSPDGTSFVITGPEWTEELSEAGALLATTIQDAYAPHGDPYIDGAFIEGEARPSERWIKVFP